MYDGLESIQIKGYRNTWSAVDDLETEQFGKVFLMENDVYGDETCYLVVNEDGERLQDKNGVDISETFDDLETWYDDNQDW
jgi:hypothetical protein